jgi:hypothetical protein
MTPAFLFAYNVSFVVDEGYEYINVLADSVENAVAKTEQYFDCLNANDTPAIREIVSVSKGVEVFCGVDEPEVTEEIWTEGTLAGGFKGIDAVKGEYWEIT